MPPLVDTRVLVLWGDIDATFDTKSSLKYMKRSINAPMGLEVKRFRDGTHWVTYELHQQHKMAKAIGKFWDGEQDVENGGRGMRVGVAQPVQGDWLAHEPNGIVAPGDEEDEEDPESPEDASERRERAKSAGRGTSP